MVDLLIIGAGTAGLTAAIYGARAGMSVKVIENAIYGGQVIASPSIENYPGIPNISGADFILKLYHQAKHFKAELLYETILSVNLLGEIKEIETSKGKHQAITVIIATGAKPRKLGIPEENQWIGRGIAFCAACDGAFYWGKDVAVIGGGNTAIGDALLLAGICSRVTLIHRSSTFKAEQIQLERLQRKDNVQVLTDTVVKELFGKSSLEGIRVENNITGKTSTLLLAGVFLAIGAKPDHSVFVPWVRLDNSGYVIAGEDCHTNLPGVFVAGDGRTKKVRQLVTATADGAVSALAAKEYLERKGDNT